MEHRASEILVNAEERAAERTPSDRDGVTSRLSLRGSSSSNAKSLAARVITFIYYYILNFAQERLQNGIIT